MDEPRTGGESSWWVVNSCFQEHIVDTHGWSGKGSLISAHLSHGAAVDQSTEPRAWGAALCVCYGVTLPPCKGNSFHKAAAVKQ